VYFCAAMPCRSKCFSAAERKEKKMLVTYDSAKKPEENRKYWFASYCNAKYHII